MVKITGDSVEELHYIKTLMDTGSINLTEHMSRYFKETGVEPLYLSFSLTNNNKILCNRYGSVIGEELPDGTKRVIEPYTETDLAREVSKNGSPIHFC